MKKVTSILILLAATFLMSGCTASYKSEFMTPQSSMQDQTSILIVTPEPGWYATVEYPTSGIEVASALAQELKLQPADFDNSDSRYNRKHYRRGPAEIRLHIHSANPALGRPRYRMVDETGPHQDSL